MAGMMLRADRHLRLVRGGASGHITDWTVVKTRWGLTIDQAEADTLHRLAAACPNTELTVTLAR